MLELPQHRPDSINPLAKAYSPRRGARLGDLWSAVNAASLRPLVGDRNALLGRENPPYDALIVDIARSVEIAERLVDLTYGSLQPAFAAALEKSTIRADLLTSMADAAKEGDHYGEAVRGGSHGDLERLRLLVAYATKNAMRRHVFEIVDAMAIPYGEEPNSCEIREKAMQEITAHLRGAWRALAGFSIGT